MRDFVTQCPRGDTLGKILLGSFASTVADIRIPVDYYPPIRAKEGNGELGQMQAGRPV